MGLFSRKRKVSTEEFCTEFYDQSIFAPDIRGMDPWKIFCETFYKSIAEADPTFEQVDISVLISELRALRLEVFGITWLHHVTDRFAPDQSEFTKCYLEEHGNADIWESMGNYNQAIARSATGGHDSNSRSGRAYITFINLMRADLFDKWVELGYDPMVLGRVANRFGSGKAWKSNRAHVYLSFALTENLSVK